MSKRMSFLWDLRQGKYDRKKTSPDHEDVTRMMIPLLQEMKRDILKQRKAANAPEVTRWLVVLDNASWHGPHFHEEALAAIGFEQYPLPTYSSDLNPQEHVWRSVKGNLDTISFGKTQRSLHKALVQAYETTLAEAKEGLVAVCKNYSARLRECIQKKGHYTHYKQN